MILPSMPGVCQISIHAPHAGSGIKGFADTTVETAFQSTLPMRGAASLSDYFPGLLDISIHAPHAGSGGGNAPAPVTSPEFQSTLPMRGAAAKIYKTL